MSDHIFPQIKKGMCFWRKIMESTDFIRKIWFWQKIMEPTNFPAKCVKKGGLTCDFLGEVDGWSLPHRRPVDHCDELLLAGGLIACERRSEERSFHVFCRKIWWNLTLACLAPTRKETGWLAEQRSQLED